MGLTASHTPPGALPRALLIPRGLRFEELGLKQNAASGCFSFYLVPLVRIAALNGLSMDWLADPDAERMLGLIAAWYTRHRADGGAASPAGEALLGERVESPFTDATPERCG